jgi:hypothetical protein
MTYHEHLIRKDIIPSAAVSRDYLQFSEMVIFHRISTSSELAASTPLQF